MFHKHFRLISCGAALFLMVAGRCGASRCQAEGRALLPTAQEKAVTWRYTSERPPEGWSTSDFDDSKWQQGPAGFGSKGTPGAKVATEWTTSDVWLRTDFEYNGAPFAKAAVNLYHDEDVQIFLNGKLILEQKWFTPRYELYDVTEPLQKAIQKGHNVVAVTCHQTSGGQYVDVGIVVDPVQELPRQLTLPPLKPLFDNPPVRDTSICLVDGTYYLTGTTGNRTGGSDDLQGWWYVNEGIRLWKSADLKDWQPMGLVWKIEDGTWQKEFHGNRRALWAPEIHHIKGTFWLTYSMNYGGTGLLKSTSGKAEGPYVDIHPQAPLAGNIDASLFADDDGSVYFVWQNGMIARLNGDMTELAEKPRLLAPSNHEQVGFEGAFLTKHSGRYYLVCADFIQGNYDCMVAESDKIYGPYGPRYRAIPHGGHNMLFVDKQGAWWSTFFGSDPRAPFSERAAILPIELDNAGLIRPKLQDGASK